MSFIAEIIAQKILDGTNLIIEAIDKSKDEIKSQELISNLNQSVGKVNGISSFISHLHDNTSKVTITLTNVPLNNRAYVISALRQSDLVFHEYEKQKSSLQQVPGVNDYNILTSGSFFTLWLYHGEKQAKRILWAKLCLAV
ncbi:MAG: hypothetical protein WC666_01035 [Candidatus Paceibacterota bacterium]|jgi:hypothetical protein